MSVFLVIGVVGVVILLVSLLFGEAIEGVLDLDFLGGDLFSTASLAAFLGASDSAASLHSPWWTRPGGQLRWAWWPARSPPGEPPR